MNNTLTKEKQEYEQYCSNLRTGIRNGDFEYVKKNFNPNIKIDQNFHLSLSVRCNKLNILQYFLEHNQPYFYNHATLLQIAIDEKYEDIGIYLIDKSEVPFKNIKYWEHFACDIVTNKNLDLFKHLISKYPALLIDVPDLLSLAGVCGQLEMVQYAAVEHHQYIDVNNHMIKPFIKEWTIRYKEIESLKENLNSSLTPQNYKNSSKSKL